MLRPSPRRSGRPCRARLPLLRAARDGQDLDGAGSLPRRSTAQSPVDGEPCGVCDSCLDITRGASFDVHELDAASNNGVDAMRDLVARASLATPGRWKVYIVDEVHMLSPGGLERAVEDAGGTAGPRRVRARHDRPAKGPADDPQPDPALRVPPARCRRAGLLLADVARDAQLELPEAAVEAAVRRGRGSARDALSALDQVVASGVVEDDSPFLHELLVSLAERDTATRPARRRERTRRRAATPPRIAAELLDELRGQFLAVMAPGLATQGEPPVPRARPSAAGTARSGSCSARPAASGRWRCSATPWWLCATPSTPGSPWRLPSSASPTPRSTMTPAPCSRGSSASNGDPGSRGAAAALRRPVASAATAAPALRRAAAPRRRRWRTGPSCAAGRSRRSALPDRNPRSAPSPCRSPRPRLAAGAPPRQPPASAPVVAPANRVGTAAEPPPESDLPPPSRDELVAGLGRPCAQPAAPAGAGGVRRGPVPRGGGRDGVLALPNSAHVERAGGHRRRSPRRSAGTSAARSSCGLSSGGARLAGSLEGLEPETSDGRTRRRRPRQAAPPCRGTASSSTPCRLPTDPAPAVGSCGRRKPDPTSSRSMLEPDDLDPLGEQVPGDDAARGRKSA